MIECKEKVSYSKNKLIFILHNTNILWITSKGAGTMYTIPKNAIQVAN